MVLIINMLTRGCLINGYTHLSTTYAYFIRHLRVHMFKFSFLIVLEYESTKIRPLRYGRLANVGYAGCTAAAAPAGYQVTLPRQRKLFNVSHGKTSFIAVVVTTIILVSRPCLRMYTSVLKNANNIFSLFQILDL